MAASAVGPKPVLGLAAPSAACVPRTPAARDRQLVVSHAADRPERWRSQGGRGAGGPSSSGGGGGGTTSGDDDATAPTRGPSSHSKGRGDYRDRPGGGGGRGGGGSRRPRTIVSESGIRLKQYVSSDGSEHLGSALTGGRAASRPFPGPPPGTGPPLRILPIGGLGEIGMNCMLAGVRDRYIVIDAGLMFPDFSDLGMQKILPDTSFLAAWRDRIEALIITHGHEDHIGALPWVIPALDPATPIYASAFVMELIKKRLSEYSLWDESRFRTFAMRERFDAGPFQVEPVRVTHSIPDCCGLILRSDEGTIVHTGDWKIDEQPLDGENFDRELFLALGSEPVALMMSDSTNVLSPGRTLSEQVVHDSIVNKVLDHAGKGRVICTQFASNLHRLYGVKRAADAAGRKICFVGASLSHYLEAAWRVGRAPFDPKELLQPEQLPHANPNEVLIVTTGSQGEPRAQLSMAARDASNVLKMLPDDLLLYSAKVIPGNEGKVTKMLNALAAQGARVRQSRADNLHTSGHAYQEELVELLQSVRPQHFLPVHGEYAFLTEHALLARERAGINFVEVIRNGEMLGVRERRNRNTVSVGSMAAARVAAAAAAAAAPEAASMVKYEGEEPTYFFNDGGRGTGTREEMEIDMRTTMASEGVVVAGLDVLRPPGGEGGLAARVRVTTRGMWTDKGRLLAELAEAVERAVVRLPGTAALVEVERVCIDTLKRRCIAFNQKRPEVIAIAYEHDPRNAHVAEVAAARAAEAGAGPGAGRRQAADVPSASQARTPRPWEAGAPASSVRAAPSGGASASGSGGAAPGVLTPGAGRRGRLAQTLPARRRGGAAGGGGGSEDEGAPDADVAAEAAEAAAPSASAPADVEVIEAAPSSAAGGGGGGGGGDSRLSRMLRARTQVAATVARSAGGKRDGGDGSGGEDEGVGEGSGDGGGEPAAAAPEASAAAAPAGGAGESRLSRMLRARKEVASTVARRASGKRDGGGGGGGGGGAAAAGPPPLHVLDPRVLQERRRRNPRDAPSQMDDPDYG